MDNSTIIAAIIPSALFLFLILYYTVWKGAGYAPKIVKTKHPIKVVGVSTKTTNESFIKDDALLWEEFKSIRNKNSMPKPEHFVLINMMPKKDEESWEYLIGTIVHDFNNIPVGLKAVEIPPQTYITVHLSFKGDIPWMISTLKIEKYLYEKWLPHSKYELNPDSVVKSIEDHKKKTETSTRSIIFYLAVREKRKS